MLNVIKKPADHNDDLQVFLIEFRNTYQFVL